MSAPSPAAKLVRLVMVSAALALLAALFVRPSLGPGLGATAVRAQGALPACRYDDILTSPRGYDDWSITLVDTILRLPKTYAPPDLVRVVDLGVPGGGKVRAVMADDLKAMSDAAKAAGNAIGVTSAYRSYATQQAVFEKWVGIYGKKRALQISARPGHSEHQLGLAIDFRSQPADNLALDTAWAGTPAGQWMKAHAWEYGFLMSYPKGKIAITCYDWEPWHFRYVGRELAALIHDSGLTTRAYLWANFTTTVVPPKPTAAPAKTAAPTAKPSAHASAVPSLPPSVPPSGAPGTLPPPGSPAPSPAPSAAPSSAATGVAGPPANPPAVDGSSAGAIGPAVLAVGAVLLGTTVLGLAFVVRKGRSGVGL